MSIASGWILCGPTERKQEPKVSIIAEYEEH